MRKQIQRPLVCFLVRSGALGFLRRGHKKQLLPRADSHIFAGVACAESAESHNPKCDIRDLPRLCGRRSNKSPRRKLPLRNAILLGLLPRLRDRPRNETMTPDSHLSHC